MKHLLWLALICLCAPVRAQTLVEDIKAGNQYLDEDRPADAVKRFSHALTLDSDSVPALFGRGMARALCHDAAGAVEDLTPVVNALPREPAARFWRGHAYRQQSQYAEAIEDFSVAIAAQKALPDEQRYLCFLYRGLDRKTLGQFAAARSDLDMAVTLDPGKAEGWAGRGRVRRAMGDEAGAQSDIARAQQIDPDTDLLLQSDSGISVSRFLLWAVIAAMGGFVLLAMTPLFRALKLLTQAAEPPAAAPSKDEDAKS